MDMVTGGVQLQMLLYACGLGFWLGAYYCLFQMFRIVVRCGIVSCFFQDVLFCVSAALVTFFVFLAVSDGCVYPYLLAGEGVGFLVFYSSVGRLLRWTCRKSVGKLRRLRRKLQKRLQPIEVAVCARVSHLQTRIVTGIRRRKERIRDLSKSVQTADTATDVPQSEKRLKNLTFFTKST